MHNSLPTVSIMINISKRLEIMKKTVLKGDYYIIFKGCYKKGCNSCNAIVNVQDFNFNRRY